MPRYIDADKAKELIKGYLEKLSHLSRACERCFAIALNVIDLTPTADVVPREEVEALQRRYDLAVAEREANVKGFAEEIAKTRAEVARKIFEDIENIAYIHFDVRGDEDSLEIIIDEFAELKKKYTEENT